MARLKDKFQITSKAIEHTIAITIITITTIIVITIVIKLRNIDHRKQATIPIAIIIINKLNIIISYNNN